MLLDSNQNTKSGTADRLSPQELPSHGESKISTDQPFTSPVKARNVNKKTPVLTESKLSRWKRHKSNEQQATQSESTSPVIVSEMDASVVPTIVKTSTIIKDTTENLSSNAKTLETPSRTPHVTESEPPTVVSAPAIKRQASEQPVTERYKCVDFFNESVKIICLLVLLCFFYKIILRQNCLLASFCCSF
ncbi:hypothetical protein DPMN_027637 [Dreissena polymorpha]|uniref:Uncharacterized protein n=1 Tax=Dreissena polymorpha TaxID=45954 RepID=A0A9D4RDT8_DREPO|nr:hypothetical protein DPMN_027637 [Dreissena polymorpha]